MREDSGDVGAESTSRQGRAAAAHWRPPGAQMDQSEASSEELAAMSALAQVQPASLQALGASPISRSLEESHDWPTFYNIQFPLCFSQFLFRGDL